ncbi:MAG: HAMP domain-containing histidine kinase, partial [Parvularculaceae bacterium]|nr:HAMP domain-containing histidine kinase [Parvularculaceae bacterium]
MRFPRLGLSARLTLLTICLVLFSQLINAYILVRAQTVLREERFQAVLNERVVQSYRVVELSPGVSRRMQRRGGPRGAKIVPKPRPEGERDPAMEATLVGLLAEEGFTDRLVEVRKLEVGREGDRRPGVALAVQLTNGKWLQSVVPMPPSAKPPWRPIIAQTILLSLILTLPAIWIGRRVAMPLRDLTAAADGFLTGKPSPPLPDKGPPDVQALSAAFAQLEERIMGALEEKSMMIGAIGHDLRTPLASLRIRVESVADDQLRDDMIASIDQLGVTLDDILTFSKATRAEALEDVRTDALTRRLASSYEADKLSVSKHQAVTLRCAPEAVLRALRNLVNNACQHGGRAALVVDLHGEQVIFHVD